VNYVDAAVRKFTAIAPVESVFKVPGTSSFVLGLSLPRFCAMIISHVACVLLLFWGDVVHGVLFGEFRWRWAAPRGLKKMCELRSIGRL
jgi:hypothetical protein